MVFSIPRQVRWQISTNIKYRQMSMKDVRGAAPMAAAPGPRYRHGEDGASRQSRPQASRGNGARRDRTVHRSRRADTHGKPPSHHRGGEQTGGGIAPDHPRTRPGFGMASRSCRRAQSSADAIGIERGRRPQAATAGQPHRLAASRGEIPRMTAGPLGRRHLPRRPAPADSAGKIAARACPPAPASARRARRQLRLPLCSRPAWTAGPGLTSNRKSDFPYRNPPPTPATLAPGR